MFDRRIVGSLLLSALMCAESLRFSKCAEEVGDCGLVDSPTRGDAVVRVVRREQAVREGAERAVFGERLDLENVECGPGNLLFAQRINKRRLVNDRAARRVDEVSRGAHQREFAAAYQVKGGRVEVAVQRDE